MSSRKTAAAIALGLMLLPAAGLAAPRCHQSEALAETLKAQIRDKLNYLHDPAMYCVMERRQLAAAKAFHDYIANNPECFVDETKRLHAVELSQKTVDSATADVAEDCK